MFKILSSVLMASPLLLLSGCMGVSSVPTVCHGETCFEVEIADSVSEHQVGLSGREVLEEGKGMLFVFKAAGVHKFWMKDTLIPLDMLWLDESGTVLYMKEYAAPCEESEPAKCQKFGSDEIQAKYVLEINGNAARLAGISEGVKLDILNLE